MLRRDRQLRVQLYQYIDGCVFALGLWLAWLIRYYWAQFGPHLMAHAFKAVAPVLIRHHWDRVDPIGIFEGEYFWLFLIVIPMTPLVLEWQGFYERQIFSPVKQMAWQLGKACTIGAGGLIL